MRISLLNTGTLYPLAGEAGVSERVHSSAADLRISPRAALQTTERVRAAAARHYDRGNLSTVITFSTTRLFDSVTAADQWSLDYDSDFPREGTLYLDSVAADGITVARKLMDNAVVSPPERIHRGCTIQLFYQIQGGAISDVDSYPSMAVTGSLTDGTDPVVFPTLIYAGLQNGKPFYTDTGDLVTYDYLCGYDTTGSGGWVLRKDDFVAGFWASGSDTDTPDLATGWTAAGAATGTPTVSEA